MKAELIVFCTLLFIFGGAVEARSVTAQTPLPPPAGTENKAATDYPLSEAQKQAIKSIRSESEKKAAPFALELAATAKKIYENMLAEKPDEQLRARLAQEMNEIVVKILSIKGQSIRDMVGVLTPEQKQLIRREMRKPDAPGDLTDLIVRTFKIPEK
jgi:Spy/CpxP family protein refolding chaperone